MDISASGESEQEGSTNIVWSYQRPLSTHLSILCLCPSSRTWTTDHMWRSIALWSELCNWPCLRSCEFVSRFVVSVLGLVPLNPIIWCYVWYYVWHYVWPDVWLNIVINKFVLLLSEIMVTWIFRHYHIVYEMHSMWFIWKITEDINYKFFVNSEFSS